MQIVTRQVEGKPLTVTIEYPQYNESTPKSDVQFILSMTIKTAKDTVSLSTTVSSAACANSICKYTADLML